MTLTTYRPELPPRLSTEVGVGVAAESFAATLRHEASVSEIDVWSDEEAAVVRELRITHFTDEEGNQERGLRIDYWLFRSDTAQSPLLVFSAPVLTDDTVEPVVELVDAIVSTVDWDRAPTR